jgi:hypothetical protein
VSRAQIVGEEMSHLLDPRRQKALLRFLLEQRLRLHVLHLGYQSNFTLTLCNIPPTRIPTPPPPPPPPGKENTPARIVYEETLRRHTPLLLGKLSHG